MVINWFPGHMKKTIDTITQDVKSVDIVMYILDARAPISSINPTIKEIVKNKTILYIINKCDLISKSDEDKIVSSFKKEGNNVLALEGTKTTSKSVLLNKLKELTKEKYDRSKAKGVEPIFKVMVIGTPNTGKSTIINTLCGQKKTMTGDKAGVTKAKQWVKITDNFALLDTPGVLWPRFEEMQVALKLAFIGSVKKDVVDQEELGFELVKFLIDKKPSVLEERYKVTVDEREPIEIYDDILRNSGCIMRGNEVDYTRGGFKVLEDFRSGKMGKICLDLV